MSAIAPATQELLKVAHKFYPRWYPSRESLGDYLENRYSSPETQALEALVQETLQDNSGWRAFLADVQAEFPDYWVTDGRPPSYDIPSYQLVIGFADPPGSLMNRHLVFRLSFLAPFYEYYETYRDEHNSILSRSMKPSPAMAAMVAVIEEKIHQHFDHQKLDPNIGKIPMARISVGDLMPGEVTLADALFEDSRRW